MHGGIDGCSTRQLKAWVVADSGAPPHVTIRRNGEFLTSVDFDNLQPNGQATPFECNFRVEPGDWIDVEFRDGSRLDGSPLQPQIDRLDLLLMGLDVARLTGLEIGPSSKPAVARHEGEVYYFDVVDDEGLSAKYRESGEYKPPFPKIDFVAGGSTLSESCGGRLFDYVVASHVIEHVADPIGWLGEIHDLLKPGGQVRLAIPDKRYMRDFQRPLTTFAELLDCYYTRLRRPNYKHVFEAAFAPQDVDPRLIWSGLQPPPADPEACRQRWLADFARLQQGEYVDVHCHTYTPDSFLSHFTLMREAGYVGLDLEAIYPTQQGHIEFFVYLHRPVEAGRDGR